MGAQDDAPSVSEYGEDLFRGKFLPSHKSHQLLVGNIIDSAYEDVVTLDYTFYYPFKYITLGIEGVYNEIKTKKSINENFDNKVLSRIPKNQYGIVFNLPFAQNIVNILNLHYFQSKVDLELALGKTISTSNIINEYWSYGVKLETDQLFENLALVFHLKNTIISPTSEQVSYNSFLVGLKYFL